MTAAHRIKLPAASDSDAPMRVIPRAGKSPYFWLAI
jgi:hypothetical protein